ncbi:MAG: hypothetical protein ABJK25_05480 [Halieaceae bacterium]
MSFIQELKQRKVFRVAAVYVVLAWGILQVLDVVSEPLSLPLWFSTVTILLIAIGFPIALIFSWIFDLGPEGPTRTVSDTSASKGVRGTLEVGLLCVLIAGIGWLIFRDVSGGGQGAWQSSGTPVVVLMDTYAPRGVYDEEIRRKSGTNADVLSDVLADFPVITQKEAIGSTWAREAQIVRQRPSLVLIHRSAFFHSMNQDLGVGYPEGTDDYSEEFHRLYQIADNKLVALLGFLAKQSSKVEFLVYSRGTGGGWSDLDYRANWIRQAEGRFPQLANRITAVPVPGGTEEGSFKRQDAVALIRNYVQEKLRLELENSD